MKISIAINKYLLESLTIFLGCFALVDCKVQTNPKTAYLQLDFQTKKFNLSNKTVQFDEMVTRTNSWSIRGHVKIIKYRSVKLLHTIIRQLEKCKII